MSRFRFLRFPTNLQHGWTPPRTVYSLTRPTPSQPPFPMAHDTRRLLEAAGVLHMHLRAAGVPHAFYGSFEVALLSNSPQSDVSPHLSHDLPPTPLTPPRKYSASSRAEAATRMAA